MSTSLSRGFCVLLVLCVSVFAVNAQVSIKDTAVPILENLDNFPRAGTNDTVDFINNTTLPNWYSSRAFYQTSHGTGTAGVIYNFGSSGNAERAIGSIASGTSGTLNYGLRLRNDSGLPITKIHIRYYGEQWRNGGSTAIHSLTFSYRIAEFADDVSAGGFTPVTALNFDSPITGSTSGALNGNLEANRTLRQATFDLDLPNGHEIMLRWTDIDNPGGDHGLAIDDLYITPYTNVTAAPASISGMVRNAFGLGLRGAMITVAGGDLKEQIVVQTGSFGTFKIDGLTAGQSYIVTVASKRYRFVDSVRLVTVDDLLTGVDFVAEP